MGDVDANIPKFNNGQQRLPIRVRLPAAARTDLQILQNLRVPTSNGTTVPLQAVADIRFQPGAARIERFDRNRRAIVEAQLNKIPFGEAMKLIDQLPIMQNLPPGVTRPAYGQSENMKEMFSSFGSAALAGIGLIFGVLVLLFKNFFKPVTILTALPLSLAGAFLALIITGSELGLSAMIGLLMLMGLSAKNSILLVEFTLERVREGMSQRDALIMACRERSRPIVMTTLAMGAGMVPTALALGEGAEFRSPMAIAVIGGLISSTVLSLVLVPVVYVMLESVEQWIRPKFAMLMVPQPEEDGADATTQLYISDSHWASKEK